MRVGSIGYRTSNGLAYQVKSYTKHLPVTKILVADLSPLNGITPQNINWYEGSRVTHGIPNTEDLEWLTTDVDVILLAETPLNYELYTIAKRKKIRTVNVINWEFFDHIIYPDFDKPDAIIMPSAWHYREAETYCRQNGVEIYQLHHPVDLDEFPFIERRSHRFMHIAGKPATYDRNGTWDFLNACTDGIVTTQSEEMARLIRKRYRNTRVITNIQDPKDIYRYGDVLVMPRKYGGNCLPLNEALASGMPVIMPDISPNNNLLPKDWLVPATVTDYFEPRTRVDIYSTDIQALYNKIEWFKTQDMPTLSRQAYEIAKTISWETLRPKYLEVLESL